MLSFFPSRTVALEVFGFSVHWYGLMYLAGFVIAYLLLPRLQKYRSLQLSSDEWSSLLTWGILGVLIGGRLGFVLFYEPSYFLSNPLDILAVWEGGMASHGGFAGVILALILFARKHNISLLALGDIVVIPAAIGLALGRLGNFINLELYGSVTSLSWGIEIPGIEGLRHPTQIYAFLKNSVIAGSCFMLLRSHSRAGTVCSLFLMLYAVLRFTVEFFRVPTHSSFEIGSFILTRGQLYSIPILMLGIAIWYVAYYCKK